MNDGWAAKVLIISFKRLNPLFLNHVEGFEKGMKQIGSLAKSLTKIKNIMHHKMLKMSQKTLQGKILHWGNKHC